MSKATSIIGIGLAIALGYVAYKYLGVKAGAGGNIMDTMADLLNPGGGVSILDNSPSESTPSTEQNVETKKRNYINDILDQLASSGKAYVSPTDIAYAGNYPALTVTEKGLFANKATGQVYPIDPTTGRQRARIDENGQVVGRYIASPSGVPYGSYSYKAIPASGLKVKYSEAEFGQPGGGVVTIGGGSSIFNTLITSKATGIKQAALVGTNTTTGEGYIYIPYK